MVQLEQLPSKKNILGGQHCLTQKEKPFGLFSIAVDTAHKKGHFLKRQTTSLSHNFSRFPLLRQ